MTRILFAFLFVALLMLKAKGSIKTKKMIFPVSYKRISSRFGTRPDPFTGQIVNHWGVDLSCDVGTKVFSPLSGIVTNVNKTEKGGNQLFIKLSNKFKVSFSHLDKILVKPGDKVETGQTVAYSGNTGKSTGPHVHLQLWDPTNNLVDPLLYFKK